MFAKNLKGMTRLIKDILDFKAPCQVRLLPHLPIRLMRALCHSKPRTLSLRTVKRKKVDFDRFSITRNQAFYLCRAGGGRG